jgi:hypothetical protein
MFIWLRAPPPQNGESMADDLHIATSVKMHLSSTTLTTAKKKFEFSSLHLLYEFPFKDNNSYHC